MSHTVLICRIGMIRISGLAELRGPLIPARPVRLERRCHVEPEVRHRTSNHCFQ